jgi:hypothetical protein
MTKSLFTFAIVAVLSAACSSGTSSGGGGESGGASGTGTGTGVGSSSGTTTGGGTSSGATGTANGETCPNQTTNECSNYFCRCADGASVNSSLCTNGQCQVPEMHCEKACQAFKHGKWTGTAGGGPKAGTSSSSSGGTSSSGGSSSATIASHCARDQAAGCEDSSCVASLKSYEAKCSAEVRATIQCAALYPACSAVSNCAVEVDDLKTCLQR